MVETVEAMLAELGPLDPTRTVLAATARRLAAVLDRMDDETANRMIGQTAGALTKVMEKLGSPSRPATGGAVAAPEPESPTGEVWYQGIEGDLYVEEIGWRIAQHARKTGLPVPGTSAYSRDPWADNVLNEEHPYGKRMRIRGRRAWFVGDVPDRQPLRLAAPR
jgi:hypothetical protein